jgi:hypothetical protein
VTAAGADIGGYAHVSGVILLFHRVLSATGVDRR